MTGWTIVGNTRQATGYSEACTDLWKCTSSQAPARFSHTRVSCATELLKPDCVSRLYAMMATESPMRRTCGFTYDGVR